jgi:hypothetical protein
LLSHFLHLGCQSSIAFLVLLVDRIDDLLLVRC